MYHISVLFGLSEPISEYLTRGRKVKSLLNVNIYRFVVRAACTSKQNTYARDIRFEFSRMSFVLWQRNILYFLLLSTIN